MAGGFPFRSVQTVGLDPASLVREGFQFTGGSIGGNNSAGAIAIDTVLGGIAPPVGSNLFVESITAHSSIDCLIWIQKANGSLIANNASSSIQPIACGPTYGSPTIPMMSLVHEGESLSFVLRSAIPSGGGSNTFNLRAGISGRRMTNDLAYEAPKTMLVIGDSISNTTGPSFGSEFYHSRLALELKSQGKHYRRIVKGDGGWRASHAALYMQRGGYDIFDPELITIMLGTNETVLADYQTNMTQIITYLRKRFPKALMCVFGPPPRQGAAEATLITMRDWAQSYVASLDSANVIYTSLAASFDRTVDNNYVSSDGAGGTRVHPTGAAHGVMCDSIVSQWNANGFIQKL